MKLYGFLILAVSIFSISHLAQASSSVLCEPHVAAASKAHGVPLPVLYAVGLTETGRAGVLSPYALNLEGQPYFAQSAADAVAAFETARKQGLKLIDVGCMQVNYHFHGHNFRSIHDMLNPRLNVDYAARFLAQLKSQQGTWTMAVARYHAGAGNIAAQKAYICRVIANLIGSGFGIWTAAAQSYCATPAATKSQ